ncbi:hypothetical protein JOQ06_019290 [Pogonophryne albipinna]|uniref:Uncharacterized protein n=1 Tax=Pogonophryne albipinna TaxID=1090488 RepID=A0AAD6FDV5_9TELE|nr:hypothetical protein JOQ06_019290 [Pogonophryne albipinna]
MLPSPVGSRQRSRSLVFGLGASITNADGMITGAKLPSGRQILRCMLYNCDVQLHDKRPGMNGALSRFMAAKVVLEQVRPFYAKANIPMVSDRGACNKMVELVDVNNKLRRIPQARRSSKATARQVDAMERRLDSTFPLWSPNAEEKIRNPEDIAFLASMKGDRVATFGAFDAKLQSKVKRRQKREAGAAARQSHFTSEQQEMKVKSRMAMLESESDEDSVTDEIATLPAENTPPCKHKKTGTTAFIPPDILSRPSLVSLATRLKITPMQQAAFTRGLITESGGNCANISASYATADRSRRQVLEVVNKEHQKQWTPSPMCTLHWDSKLTPTLSNVRQLEERLTVVVGDAEQLKLLGVPAYTKGKDEACGEIIARLTCKLLQDWCCADQVVNMAFDTTASNTGHLTAACIAIQVSLDRPLLWSGCRHHIGEVLLSHIFTNLKVEASRSPEVTLFKRLQDNWNLLPHKYSGPLSRYITANAEQPFLGKLRAELTVSAAAVIDYKRGDYHEFVQLCLVYLGADDAAQTPVNFQRPGALHKARWMAKLLYTLKLALMEQHIALLPQGTITTRQQVPKIRAFANFITHIYATWWLTCDTAVYAAWNDLKLYHNLYTYKSVDEGIATSAMKALERHLWYLTGEMLPLALFSNKVPADERRALADAILEHKPDDLPMRAPQQRFGTGFGKPKFPVLSPTTRLADLANPDCWFGMHQLHIDPAFLSLTVEDWATSASFQAGVVNVRAINVVNDCAERGVKLTSDFVAAAKSEQHLQNVLQAVEHDRCEQPNLRRCKRKLNTVKD